MSEKPAPRLGRGLDALLGTVVPLDVPPSHAARGGVLSLRLTQIVPGPFQPRRHFPLAQLEELAQSIRAKGVLQPVLVRPVAGAPGRYELVAGERRWRAAQQAQLHEIPAIVRELSAAEALEVALVENLQRTDLSAIEEAAACQRLIDEFGHTQEEMARILGKSRSHLANTLRLLALPEPVRDMVDAGTLSPGHARLLVGMAPPAAGAAAALMVERRMSVREAERMVGRMKRGNGSAPPRAAGDRSADIVALERALGLELGLAVEIRHRGASGRLIIRYKTPEQLDGLLARLGHSR